MFDICGDSILFDGYTVDLLHPFQPIGIRMEAEKMLLDFQDPFGLVTEEDHCREIEEAEKRSYDEGHAEGFEKGKQEADDATELDAQQREKQAYAEGRADALSDMDRAADVARVAELLAQLKKAHDALLLWQGIQEPGAYRKRPIKLSEAKTTMQRAAAVLRLALNAYERPNGAE